MGFKGKCVNTEPIKLPLSVKRIYIVEQVIIITEQKSE